VPTTSIPQQKVSEKAQSLSLIDLAWDSDVVLSENNGSNNKIIYAAHRRKKRKLVPSPALQSSKEVQVIEQVTLNLEVDSQDLPKTGRFGDYANKTNSIGSETVTGSSSDKSVNLLADNLDEV
jgi:hypothetical protein